MADKTSLGYYALFLQAEKRREEAKARRLVKPPRSSYGIATTSSR